MFTFRHHLLRFSVAALSLLPIVGAPVALAQPTGVPASKAKATATKTASAQIATEELIMGIEQDELRQAFGLTSSAFLSDNGISYALSPASESGAMVGVFSNAVFDSPASAQGYLTQQDFLQEEWTIQEWGEAAPARMRSSARLWKGQAPDLWKIALRFGNAVFSFDFRGSQGQVAQFVSAFPARLTKAPSLFKRPADFIRRIAAPRVVVPALVTPGETIPIYAQTSPFSVALVSIIGHTKSGRTLLWQKPQNELASPLFARVAQAVVALPAQPVTALEVIVVNSFARLTRETVSLRSVSPEGAGWRSDATPWVLPESALYFTFPASAQNRPPVREQLNWKSLASRPLPIRDKAEVAMTRLEAWNSLARFVQPQWLPPLESLKIGQSPTNLNEVTFFAPWSRAGQRGVFWGLGNGQFWLYIEQPTSVASELPDSEVLDTTFFASLSNPTNSYFSRVFLRQRSEASKQDGESVRALLIRVKEARFFALQ